MDIHADITGTREVGLRFEEFPDALYDDLKAEIGELTEQLYALVEAATPTRTGKLRGEERMRVFTDPTRISGYVDIAAGKGSEDFAKAGALEYGAHRSTKVDAHNMRLDHLWSRRLSAPLLVLVAAYTRTPDIQEYSFERGPLEAMAPEILARLNAVVDQAAATANAERPAMDAHEAALAALFEALQSAAGFRTTGRRVQHWGQVADQPALFLRHIGDTDQFSGELRIITLECEVWVYSNAGQDPDAAPDIALTSLVRAVRRVFTPDDDARFTLGGLVYWCRIEGRSDYSPGDQGPQAIARLPVRITLPY